MNAPVNDLNRDEHACAAWIARFLQARGIDRIFGLQGGHIQPILDWLGRLTQSSPTALASPWSPPAPG